MKLSKRDQLVFSITYIYLSFVLLNQLFAGKWWVWNIFSIIPPTSFFVLAILILIVNSYLLYKLILSHQAKQTGKKAILVVAHLTLVLLACTISVSISDIRIPLVVTKSEGNNEITLFNWNSQYWESESKLPELYDFLKTQDADIYQLQEFLLPESSTHTDMTPTIQFYISDLQTQFPEYTVIHNDEFITMTRLEVHKVYHSADLKYLRVDILDPLSKKPISFYNVHIPVQFVISSPNTFFQSMYINHENRITAFNQLEDDVERNSNPIVVSGDFNTTSSMGMMVHINSVLKDSQLVSNNLFPATWALGPLKLWRIDYVLSNNQIIFTDHIDVSPNGLSDHWGQKVTLYTI